MTVTFWAATWEGSACTWDGPDLNVSNANATALLRLLGYVTDEQEAGELGTVPGDSGCGDADAEDFAGRVLLAVGLLSVATDDEHGTPAVSGGGPGTGRAMLIDCGRRPGYLADRLAVLGHIAREAAAHGARVTWA